ncbi:cbb3-type cytochrome oxidase subunit 3 [Albirhodobacter sp. R86504]|jgi:cytochrome c oxidase cbb3-type subunit 4|uniref:cbb3-type cytochrome oxidase subunit 3 n=1 Tax=Albirhodobacter sp. R86504 TaxID=3093848 RepID=UPI00366FE8DE
MDYHILREFADSWALLSLFCVFVFVILWVFRPGVRKVHEDVASIPFRHEDKPAPRGASAARTDEGHSRQEASR